MSFSIELRFHPVYELLNSLNVYVQPSFYKKVELGTKWRNETKKKLSHEFAAVLESEQKEGLGLLYEYIFGMELKNLAIEQIIQVLLRTEENEVIDYSIKHLHVPEDKLASYQGTFQNSLQILQNWNEEYFQHIDPNILSALEMDSKQKLDQLDNDHSIEFVEKVTNGLLLRGFTDVKKVVLYPVYHASPINTFSHYQHIHFYGYPVDLIPTTEEPSPNLMRRSVALSDKSRLQILRYLVQHERSFTDIVKFIGLAKSTVHHHLVILRAAGLVQVIMSPHSSERFRLREEGLRDIFEDFQQFLKPNRE
ncbi:winged helix-turn-helix domain-containing protein [Robertmurraya massiliosenegalensis]|uniref:ArsR/SmtB family transcription factor n=1 Tax=Robertmurraya TaxID=2837507 RepID=UPI0039A7105D